MKPSSLAFVFALACLLKFEFAAASQTINQHAWHDRLLVVFAADSTSAQLAAQRTAIADIGPGFAQRNLVLVEVIGESVTGASDSAAELRRRYGVKANTFRALLIGKDGGVKIDSPQAIMPQQLISTIDAMPMRRQEAREQAVTGEAHKDQ
ncbi:DUF4174 domain-containing protein [Caballeronia sordidicola]|uniref:DUF4174 domain-containing protein n=1 Tax=Caballeronia sordidicola TaxID=196367 RepID=A0A226WYE4_CABSO|nr:DUF4174 domain-containing protein [Caballeronia sordidicola]OXC75889.1 hypothetical protein BSU04_24545 [Caballeronia sordidicola]